MDIVGGELLADGPAELPAGQGIARTGAMTAQLGIVEGGRPGGGVCLPRTPIPVIKSQQISEYRNKLLHKLILLFDDIPGK